MAYESPDRHGATGGEPVIFSGADSEAEVSSLEPAGVLIADDELLGLRNELERLQKEKRAIAEEKAKSRIKREKETLKRRIEAETREIRDLRQQMHEPQQQQQQQHTRPGTTAEAGRGPGEVGHKERAGKFPCSHRAAEVNIEKTPCLESPVAKVRTNFESNERDNLQHELHDIKLAHRDIENTYGDPIAVHTTVLHSGVPNFEGAKIPVQSNLNIPFWEANLSTYADKQICELLKFGFPLGFDCERVVLSEDAPKNHAGARQFPTQVEAFLQEEISSGCILGPFDTNPLGCSLKLSPLNTVPKPESSNRKIILDLSFPRGGSVNEGIDKDRYLGEPVNLKYPKVDDLVEKIKIKGRGCCLFKKDLKKAYRQVPIDPGDIHLVAFQWKSKIYMDRVLSMGLRSAAQICQRVTSAVVFMFTLRGFELVNYLDDLAGAEKPELAVTAFRELDSLLQGCGLVQAVDKECPPSTQMSFVGVLFNTVTMTLEITPKRLSEILELVDLWLNKKTANVTELQSILGKLNFVSACVRPGRLFVSRLIAWLRSIFSRTDQVEIPVTVKKDLKWWKTFLLTYNGISMMMTEEWSGLDEVFSSDACLFGGGGVCETEYCHFTFPPNIVALQLSINALELLTILVCLKLWAAKFRGRRILLSCDNAASVSVLNSGRARSPYMQDCLREICYLAAVYEFEVRAQHIPGVDNRLPDLLSRWELGTHFRSKFFEQSKSLNLVEHKVSNDLFQFSHRW